MFAALREDDRSVRSLIRVGAALDAYGTFGETALMFSVAEHAQEGSKECATALLNAGANLLARDCMVAL